MSLNSILLTIFWVLAMGGLVLPALWLLLACAVFVCTLGVGLWALSILFSLDLEVGKSTSSIDNDFE